jgi:hypothetical protein
VAYCKFWQRKLHDNKGIEFPDKLCDAIADITHDFSFAYIQEAFVAALLAIAGAREGKGKVKGAEEEEDEWVVTESGDDLEDLELWVEIKKQVAILRESLGKGESMSVGMDEKEKGEGMEPRHGEGFVGLAVRH